jgi:hypothetical protein
MRESFCAVISCVGTVTDWDLVIGLVIGRVKRQLPFHRSGAAASLEDTAKRLDYERDSDRKYDYVSDA